jgi:hypothetical protein
MRKSQLLFLFIVLVSIVSVKTAQAEANYTEMDLTSVGDATGGWDTVDISAASVPANSIVEIIATNDATASTNVVGVREVGSGLSRTLTLSEAENGGVTTVRFLTNVDGSQQIQLYDDNNADIIYYVVGYWQDATFTEQWVNYEVTRTEDDMWHETDGTELTLQADRVHLITIYNDEKGNQYLGGVRNTSSTLDRYMVIMESEGGITQATTMFVTSDANSKIDVYSAQYDDLGFYNQGYFGTELEFIEYYEITIANNNDDTWYDWDLTAYLDQDGRIVDTHAMNPEESAERNVGVRANGDSHSRYFNSREAEGGGSSITGLTVQTDGSGIIEIYHASYSVGSPVYAILGYFKPVVVGANNIPINWALTITDFDDTDNLYAEKQFYTIDYDGYDSDGYADIHEVYIWINQSATNRAIIKYDEDIDTFSLVSGNWEIDAGTSSATRSGTDLNLTIKFTPSWDAVEESDLDFGAVIYDDEPSSDSDTLQTNYADSITDLLTSSIECTDANDPDRVDVGVNSQIDFQVYYADNPGSATPSNDYPPDSEFTSISIYDSSNNNEGTDSSIVNGAGSVSFQEATVQPGISSQAGRMG